MSNVNLADFAVLIADMTDLLTHAAQGVTDQLTDQSTCKDECFKCK